ncbi:hypothetical protein J6Z48_00835 [bacterium]|nr:hypothetical protein [bacterium]
MEENEESFQQLDLGIKEPRKNKYYKIKGKIDKKRIQIENRKLFNDPLVWAFITIGIILILQQIRSILISYDTLPTYIEVFRYKLTIDEQLAHKQFINIYPTISILSLVISFIFVILFYNKERNFTKMLIISSLLCIIAQSIILVEILH